jgi:hypothetical protein
MTADPFEVWFYIFTRGFLLVVGAVFLVRLIVVGWQLRERRR